MIIDKIKRDKIKRPYSVPQRDIKWGKERKSIRIRPKASRRPYG